MSATERPISTVLQEIVGNVQDIMRSEIYLAKTEVREELKQTRSASGLLAVGVAGGFFSALFALLTLVYALSLVIPAWAAALCVAAAVGIFAGITIRAGLTAFKMIHIGAPKTVASLKENSQWAKRQIK